MESAGKMYLLFQQHEYTTLLDWDPVTYKVKPALCPWNHPVHIKAKPDQTGFAFIEDDSLKVKLFYERSAQCIPLTMPLHTITMFSWINDDYLCCSAKKGSFFGLYLISLDGTTYELAYQQGVHFKTPCFAHGRLYYVKQEENCTLLYYQKLMGKLYFSDPVLYNNCGAIQVLAITPHPFDGVGVLSYNNNYTSDEAICMFSFYFASDDNSDFKKLFDFYLQKKYLIYESKRLCELFFPIIPLIKSDVIYFVSQSNLYFYSFSSDSFSFVSSFNSFITVPLESGFYGGFVQDKVCVFYDMYDVPAAVKLPALK